MVAFAPIGCGESSYGFIGEKYDLSTANIAFLTESFFIIWLPFFNYKIKFIFD